MAAEGVQFKFDVGDPAFLLDSLTKASKSVFRVDILERSGLTGRPMYLVRPSSKKGFRPWWLPEDVLTDEPSAANLSPALRARWKHARRARCATRR